MSFSQNITAVRADHLYPQASKEDEFDWLKCKIQARLTVELQGSLIPSLGFLVYNCRK